MKKVILSLVMTLTPIWKQFGADPGQLRAILNAKLQIDGRRQKGIAQASSSSEYMEYLLLFFYVLFGVFGLFMFIAFEDRFTALSFYLTFWCILVLITLITDYSEIFLDTRDNHIILPTPVSNATISLSRVLHLVIFLGALVIPFIIPSVVYFIVKKDYLAIPLVLILMIAALIFTILILSISYLLILKKVDSTRFKEIINSFQIAFSVVIFSSYYVLPRIFEKEMFTGYLLSEKWYQFLIPGSYFAAINEVISGERSMSMIVMAILGVLLPLLALYLSSKVLAKGLAGQLGKLSVQKEVAPQSEEKEMGWYLRMCHGLIKNNLEKNSFLLTWRVTARDRMYKLKTLPIFGMIPAFFFYYAFDTDGDLSTKYENMSTGNYDLLLIYFSLIGVMTPLINAMYSSNFKGANIYRVLPIRKPGLIIRGNTMAILFKYGVPTITIVALSVFLIWGLDRWLNVLVGIVNVIIAIMVMAHLSIEVLPFSQSWQNQSKGSNTARMFLLMFAIGLIGFGHWIMRENTLVLIIYMVFALVIAGVFYKTLGEKTWKDIRY